MRFWLIAAALVPLSACVTAVGTTYGPATRQGYGYTASAIEADRYRVSFSGDGATPVDVVEDYALLRAAEIGLENGYDWFRVVGRSLDEKEKGGVGIGAGLGGGSRNVGVGVGGNLGTVGAKKFYVTTLEVLYGRGEKPAGDDRGEVYDVRAVIETIRARVTAAEAPAK